MKLPKELLHKSRVKISGIYQITNIVNGQKYIGSSEHLYRRFSDHAKYLSRGTHSNPKLQNSWNKYGGENFVFYILEYVSPEFVRDVEQEYIDLYQPELNISRVVGYPNTPKAGSIEAKLRSQKNLEARRNSEWYNSKELRGIMSDKSKKRWEDLVYRNRRVEETKRLWENPEYRGRLSEVHKKIKDDDRQKIRDLRSQGYSVKSLFEMFGVARITIQRIVRETS